MGERIRKLGPQHCSPSLLVEGTNCGAPHRGEKAESTFK